MKSRIAQNILLLLTLGIPAMIFASLLYYRAAPVAESIHRQIAHSAAKLAEADGRLNQYALATRLDLDSTTEELEDLIVELNQPRARLQQLLENVAPNDQALMDSISAYATEINHKIELTKQFEHNNALLDRNATTAATTGEQALSELTNAAAASPSAKQKRSQLHDQLKLLISNSLNRSNFIPSDGGKTTEKAITQLRASLDDALKKAAITEAHLVNLTDVVQAIESITVLRGQVDQSIALIIEKDTRQVLDQVQSAYDQFYDRRLARNENYRTGLLAYFALLTVGAVYFGLRWRSRDRMRILQHVNMTLEQHVNSRTEELSEAYEELKESQGRLVQSEKMSALGQMVAGVAHEINTPLAYSRSNVDLVMNQLTELNELLTETNALIDKREDPSIVEAEREIQYEKVAQIARTLQEDAVAEEMNELLQASASGLDQIAEMVMSLKNFSRVDRKKVERFNLNEGIDSSLLIAQNKLKHKVKVIKNYGDIPPVTCSPSQINQVFLNMLVNAAQAIKDQGTITITTVASGDHVDVIIEDTGSGIPEEVLPNIFDPFYTTKDVGEGTGLGLSICYQIVEQHGGTISVDSQTGVGTRFTISLFVAEDDLVANQSVGQENAVA